MKAYPTFHYYHYGKLVEKYESDRTVSEVAPEVATAEGRDGRWTGAPAVS